MSKTHKVVLSAVKAAFPHLQESDGLLYLQPVGRILRGVVVTTYTRDPGRLQVAIFARPLYVPSESPILGNFTRPLRRGRLSLLDNWDIGELADPQKLEALRASVGRAIPSLDRVSSPELFAKHAVACFGRGNRDLQGFAVGLSFLAAGDSKSGIQALSRIQCTFPEGLQASVNQALAAAKTGSETTSRLLSEWERQTVSLLEDHGLKIRSCLV